MYENNVYAYNIPKTFFRGGESFSMEAKPSLTYRPAHQMIRYAEITL